MGALGGPEIATLLPSWELSLDDERQLSPNTQAVYLRTVRLFAAWLTGRGLPSGTEDVGAEHIRAFLAYEAQRTSAISAHQHYRNLRVFFGWLASEGERKAPNPMERVERPKVTKKAKPFFDDDELTRLLKTC